MSRAIAVVCLGSIVSSLGLAACAKSETGTGGGAAGGGNFTSIGGGSGTVGKGGSGGSVSPTGGAQNGGGGTPSGGVAGSEPEAGGSAGAAGASSGGASGSGGSVSGGGTTASGGGGSGGTTSSGGGGIGAFGGGGSGATGAKGDCCTETVGSKGCLTPSVEQCVCATDPFCCNFAWDDACAGQVLSLKCGTCPMPADCCSPGSQAGCGSVAVSSCVCDSHYECCSTGGWTAACVGYVASLGCGTCGATTSPLVWINELHYDNASTDSAEGVEVAGAAGTDLGGFKVVFYNGNATQLSQYLSKTLSGVIPNQQNGFGTAWFAVSGIQNGGADATPEPDGVALVDAAGKLVQFVSYEGAFTAADGPAQGAPSTNIGVTELSTSPAGQSLQLTGTGKKYTDFTWAGSATATAGQKNTGQTFQ